MKRMLLLVAALAAVACEGGTPTAPAAAPDLTPLLDQRDNDSADAD